MSNAYAGYFLAGGRELSPRLVAALMAAGLFIMAGMALNDVADKDVDARERPTRPIPSGAIPLSLAWNLSLGMMILGLALLAYANPVSLWAGSALCAAIFAYNFLLKGTAFGPAAMGLCRALNLLTGMSLTWSALPSGAELLDPAIWPKSMWLAVFSLWAYIALVTFLARDEVGGNTRRRLWLFLAGLVGWALLWPVSGLDRFRSEPLMALAWLALGLFLRGPLRNLATEPSPKHTGQMVGAMLRLVPLVDVIAMLANHVPPPYALAGALWILPAFAVGKWFYST
jgi:4-hydroxybenzoate polyprenyltransferase